MSRDYDPIKEYLIDESMLKIFFHEVGFCISNCITQKESHYPVLFLAGHGNKVKIEKTIRTPGNIACCVDECSELYSGFSSYSGFTKLIEERDRIYPRINGRKSYVVEEFENVCSAHTIQGCHYETHRGPVCISFACADLEMYISESFGIKYRTENVRDHLEFILTKGIRLSDIHQMRSQIYDAIIKVRTVKSSWPILNGTPQNPALQL